MTAIGTELIRTELVFHPAVLERVDYVGTTYECPKCKDTLEPQFLKDKGTAPLIPHSYASEELVKRRFLAADETPIQVLNEEGRRAQSKSYIWLFRSGDDELAPIIIYKYHSTRNGDAAAMLIYVIISKKPYRREKLQIIPIRHYRAFCIVISFLNMKGVTMKRAYHLSRSKTGE